MQIAEQKILSKYEKLLVFPEHKPKGQFLLCPVGLVGSGKTTVTKPLSKELSLLRISGDEIRKLLKENGLNYEAVFDIASVLVNKYLGLGYSIAIDSDCASEKTQKLIFQSQQDYKIKIIWLHINPPEDFIIKKLMNFKHSWLFKDGEDAVRNYMRRKFIHEKLEMPFIYTFDTSKSDLPSQITEAINLIKSELAKDN